MEHTKEYMIGSAWSELVTGDAAQRKILSTPDGTMAFTCKMLNYECTHWPLAITQKIAQVLIDLLEVARCTQEYKMLCTAIENGTEHNKESQPLYDLLQNILSPEILAKCLAQENGDAEEDLMDLMDLGF